MFAAMNAGVFLMKPVLRTVVSAAIFRVDVSEGPFTGWSFTLQPLNNNTDTAASVEETPYFNIDLFCIRSLFILSFFKKLVVNSLVYAF